MMAEEQKVKLLGAWFSPFVYRVGWALKLKGVAYEYIEQDLIKKSSLLLHCNPIHKRVPVLIHGGKPIPESLVIIDYIDNIWKHNPIFPADPHQRALAHVWAMFIEEKLTESVRRALMLEGEHQEKEVEQAKDALEILEGEIRGKKFFGGDSLGFVDIVLGWISLWLGVIEEVSGIKVFDPIEYPRLKIWMDTFLGLPLIKESLPPRASLLMYFYKIRHSGLASASQK